MSAAYIVCGPASSGNHMLVAILKRAGCIGPKPLPEASDTPFVCSAHIHLSSRIRYLKNTGFDPVWCIVIVREPMATFRSAMKATHVKDLQEAHNTRWKTIAINLMEAAVHGAKPEVVTYEGLCAESLSVWLPRLGLTHKSGLLAVEGHPYQSIVHQNKKHY